MKSLHSKEFSYWNDGKTTLHMMSPIEKVIHFFSENATAKEKRLTLQKRSTSSVQIMLTGCGTENSGRMMRA
jgi:hypothetical protein